MAKGTVPDDHPLLLGMPGFWGLEITNAYTRNADVVLALGTRFAETDASSWDPDYTWRFPPSRLIQIDIDPAEIGRNYPVEIGVVADTALAVAAIADAVSRRPFRPAYPATELRDTITAARAGAFAAARERGRSDQFPLRPERILADLRATLPADAVLVTDVGWNKNGVAQCYPLPAEGRFITPGGASTMGFGPAAAVGVQIGDPERVVVALIGDGGMSAQLPAVPMAVEQGLPVIFLVMNNRAHGTIADLQAANFGAQLRLRVPRPGRQPVQPRLRGAGRACGADGYPIAAPADLRTALRDGDCGDADRPCSTCRWSTSRCPRPGTGTSRTSTRVSSITPPHSDPHPEAEPCPDRDTASAPRRPSPPSCLAAAACSAPGASSSPSSGAGGGQQRRPPGPIKIAVVDAQSGSASDLGQFECRGRQARRRRRGTRPAASTAGRSS